MPKVKPFLYIFFFTLFSAFFIFISSSINPNQAYAADITAPVTTYTKTPSLPDGKNGWYTSVVRFDLSSSDLESGVREINHRIDSEPWETVYFNNSVNLAQNPSFEEGLSSWEATLQDADTTYEQDGTDYAPSYPNASAKIASTGTVWHGLNNKTAFAVATPLSNMTASIYMKTQDVTQSAGFSVYAVAQDGLGNITYNLIGSSPTLTGTTAWTPLSFNFTVSGLDSIGVYIDIGLTGSGTIWADAVSINSSSLSAVTTFTVASDSTSHSIQYYAVDNSGNTETTHTVTFKQDMTPPGNWNDSGAFRGLFGSDYQLWVYTNVQDATSGISTFTDKYYIKTELHEDYGRFSNILSCSSTWQPNTAVILISPPFFPGVHSAYLLTPKTSFCNNNWKICKIVRFFSEDMAGNTTTKDFCINGPWVKIRGKGFVRSNSTIDMLSEADGDNTDGLIEASGDGINFFTSTTGWEADELTAPTTFNYDDFMEISESPDTISNNTLRTSSGTYLIDGNFTANASSIPAAFSTATFNQVIFINGDLKVDTTLAVSNASTALFIVKGNVSIAKTVVSVKAGIFADGTFSSAYDLAEGEATTTLELKGVYSANQFIFQRTLQGTDNSNLPSESFVYEPKYPIQLKDRFGKYIVKWVSVE
ncbi:MAG: hypothetical protein ACD_22C00242G0002 [uncultured bacterium]|nr:MAG: hypothetical protein ACD_22C00242G0002 [uncultured bacterium]